jgi:hypothetical protein
MAAQNLKPAEKQPDHTTGWHNPVKSNQLIINWYQQTWHTIEFSNNRHIRILLETIYNSIRKFICFAFLRCDVYSLFHSYSLCKSGLFSRYSPGGTNPPITNGSFSSFHALHMKNRFSSEGGLSPLSGGDSEDITRSPAAVQIGCEGACNRVLAVPEVLDP